MQPPLARPPPPRAHEETCRQGGWTFTARKAPIIGSPLLEQYSDRLGGVLTLPEILFGNSSLQLVHEASGITLSYTAFAALQQWKADDLPPLKVAVAKEWQAARQQEIREQQAVVLDYDWTFTTSYAGDVSIQQTAGCHDPSSSSSDGGGGCGAAQHDSSNHADQPSFCWAGGAAATQSSTKPAAAVTAAAAAAAAAGHAAAGDAAAGAGHPTQATTTTTSRRSDQGTLPPTNVPSAASAQQQQQQMAAALPAWQPTERQIDRHMLMSKSEPILFYAEVPLYESELDDNGVCQLTVKVRVMPRCWLVLLRLWLRVDGSLVRLREVRHFCRLDQPDPVVLRETKWSEGTMSELAAAGAPTSVSGYEDAEAATGVFGAIAPQCLKKFELHELRLAGVGGSGGGCGDGAAGGVEEGSRAG